MVTDEMLKRINELYHKSKETGLSDEEKEEQAKLRRAYADAFKANLKSQLESIKIQQPDGTLIDVKKRHDEKYGDSSKITS